MYIVFPIILSKLLEIIKGKMFFPLLKHKEGFIRGTTARAFAVEEKVGAQFLIHKEKQGFIAKEQGWESMEVSGIRTKLI